MKRRQSTEPDLFVINKELTVKEKQEMRDFIEEHKKKTALKKNRHRKAA